MSIEIRNMIDKIQNWKPHLNESTGKNIVYDNDGYQITVDDINDAQYVVLWYDGDKVGNLSVDSTRLKLSNDNDFNRYLKVSHVFIQSPHRGNGFGLLLYKTLLQYCADNVKGIISHGPNRSNKKQIPKIYKKLGGYEDNDWYVIPT